jgi:hypothetical protein
MDATTAASSPSINARLRFGTSKASARGASAANQERQDRKAGATSSQRLEPTGNIYLVTMCTGIFVRGQLRSSLLLFYVCLCRPRLQLRFPHCQVLAKSTPWNEQLFRKRLRIR